MWDDKSTAAFLQLQGPGLLYLTGAYNDPFWHFTLSVSLLKLHNTALHNTAPLHLTSPYNVPSVETEEGFTQSRPVAVVLLKASALWLVFPWTIRHFHPVAFSLSSSLASQDERDVQWMRLPTCQPEFNSWQMQDFLIIYCIWFSTLPQEGLKRDRELGGKGGEMGRKGTVGQCRWKWQGLRWRERWKRGGEEVTGGPGTRRDDVKREGRTERAECFLKKETFANFPPLLCCFFLNQCMKTLLFVLNRWEALLSRYSWHFTLCTDQCEQRKSDFYHSNRHWYSFNKPWEGD